MRFIQLPIFFLELNFNFTNLRVRAVIVTLRVCDFWHFCEIPYCLVWHVSFFCKISKIWTYHRIFWPSFQPVWPPSPHCLWGIFRCRCNFANLNRPPKSRRSNCPRHIWSLEQEKLYKIGYWPMDLNWQMCGPGSGNKMQNPYHLPTKKMVVI